MHDWEVQIPKPRERLLCWSSPACDPALNGGVAYVKSNAGCSQEAIRLEQGGENTDVGELVFFWLQKC